LMDALLTVTGTRAKESEGINNSKANKYRFILNPPVDAWLTPLPEVLPTCSLYVTFP
jgi:hypothetical protein